MLYFATGNKNKFQEAKRILAAEGVTIRHFSFSHTEIRSDRLEEIAVDAAAAAYARLKKPVFVEDSGLFIDALRRFPGTYSAWTEGKLGYRGILKLMKGIRNRKAYFGTTIALATSKGIRIFRGRCNGRMALRANGKQGFGYDPIFVPAGHRQTFAQSISLKNKLSHRYKSLLALVRHLKNMRIRL